MSTYKPPEPLGRAVVGVEWLEPEEDGQVRALITCDCGTATDLTVEIRGETPGSQQAAFTCGGCQTPHWFTITATG